MTAHLDGNVLAGAMSELLTADITTAIGQCVSCGNTAPMGQARVYAAAPGMIARCPACDEVILRLVRAPGRAWLDLRGVSYLQLQVPAT